MPGLHETNISSYDRMMVIVLPVTILAYYYPGLAQTRAVYTMLRISSQSDGGRSGWGGATIAKKQNSTLLNHPGLRNNMPI